ncbi:M24 family metallopeptidase [Oceanithermus desulfurans]|uniref:Aminopeptidase n=2 Tax=Oceanithermus desulfurans TaxID=227924 RepID=A0A511RJQ0_9DEIN|nr:aminopeptidase P family protein [Oceanithermus desulfurans]MBB6030382.1 Xaa-Pro aminopeptidase [Oceanithermus desulfurans]GEM89317.1 aminopeptidase [Oceanithermus desulfurans NBRC 100063]
MNVSPPPNVDALLVKRPENVRYLSGFTAPEDAWVLYRPEAPLLFTDARYGQQAPAESRIAVEIVNPREGYGFLEPHVAGLRVGYEARHLPCADLERLRAATSAEWVATENLVEQARRVKTPEEVERIRAAAALADRGLAWLLPRLRPGVRERDLALDLEFWLRREGAEAAAFDFIVASGPRGALPHGVASDKTVEAGELVTLDFGAVVGGYHSDMTRTVAVGAADGEMRRIFDVVLQALEAALDAARPGVAARELDAVARCVVEAAGYGPRFVHSLGHGVGLEIHEAPFLNARSDEVLEPGMVITLEPGVYLPGRGGVRIEELALVTTNGIELLSHSPRGWTEV